MAVPRRQGHPQRDLPDDRGGPAGRRGERVAISTSRRTRVLALSLAALALALVGCGSGGDDPSPQPDVDQVEVADAALAAAGDALAEARGRLSAEANAAPLGTAERSLRRAAALVRTAAAGTEAAMLAQGDLDSVRQALAEADRFVRRAVDEALRANEAVLDAAAALDVAPDELIDPRTDQAMENASEKVNEASTEVAVALRSAGG